MKAKLHPCNDCPFRMDCPARLPQMEEIVNETVFGDKYHVCHKTVDLPTSKQRLCAGKLILEEKVNRYGNRSTRMAIALQLFPGYDALRGKDLCFETAEAAKVYHAAAE